MDVPVVVGDRVLVGTTVVVLVKLGVTEFDTV